MNTKQTLLPRVRKCSSTPKKKLFNVYKSPHSKNKLFSNKQKFSEIPLLPSKIFLSSYTRCVFKLISKQEQKRTEREREKEGGRWNEIEAATSKHLIFRESRVAEILGSDRRGLEIC